MEVEFQKEQMNKMRNAINVMKRKVNPEGNSQRAIVRKKRKNQIY